MPSFLFLLWRNKICVTVKFCYVHRILHHSQNEPVTPCACDTICVCLYSENNDKHVRSLLNNN